MALQRVSNASEPTTDAADHLPMSFAPRIIPALLVLIAALLQVSVVQGITAFGASPDLLVLVVVSTALLDGSVAGAAYGFIGGVSIGLAAAIPLGPHALVGTFIGYWAGRWGELLVTDEHPVPPLLAGIVGTLAMQIGRPLVEFLMVPGSSGAGIFGTQTLVATVFNAVLVVPVYVVVRKVARPRRADPTSGGLAAET
jgi:rod shape-determining protein MreD